MVSSKIQHFRNKLLKQPLKVLHGLLLKIKIQIKIVSCDKVTEDNYKLVLVEPTIFVGISLMEPLVLCLRCRGQRIE